MYVVCTNLVLFKKNNNIKTIRNQVSQEWGTRASWDDAILYIFICVYDLNDNLATRMCLRDLHNDMQIMPNKRVPSAF